MKVVFIIKYFILPDRHIFEELILELQLDKKTSYCMQNISQTLL